MVFHRYWWPAVFRGMFFAWLLLVLIGCNAAHVSDPDVPELEDSTIVYDDWRVITVGIQRRDVSLAPYSGGVMELVRIDPAAVTFRIHYRPDDPLTLTEWHSAQPDATVLVNAAFFDESRQALGLLVSDGQFFGQSFVGFGGMFQVTDTEVRVRSLVSEPYQGETLRQAVQAFPVLIETGGVRARQGEGFSTQSRRTWIGQDHSGRIIIAVTHWTISFYELQTWLLNSDLDLYSAFALDGGRSSGLLINVPGSEEFYPSFDRLSSVIAVYAR